MLNTKHGRFLDETINKRVMIKRQDEDPLASCVALLGPGKLHPFIIQVDEKFRRPRVLGGMSGPAKRLVEPVKRDGQSQMTTISNA